MDESCTNVMRRRLAKMHENNDSTAVAYEFPSTAAARSAAQADAVITPQTEANVARGLRRREERRARPSFFKGSRI